MTQKNKVTSFIKSEIGWSKTGLSGITFLDIRYIVFDGDSVELME